jgi:signal transduction histidine kinase
LSKAPLLDGVDLTVPCTGSKMCPISSSPCPGLCIFADILASISLGIVVFDLESRGILFCNRWARDQLARARVPMQFQPLHDLLLPSGGGRCGAVVQPGPVRMGTRFFGFTVYYGTNIAWVFLRDITDKMRFEAIAEAVETTNNLGYVFSAVRHELGNPINSIKMALSVLQANLVTSSREMIADYIDRMLTEIARVERLLRSLRSFSAYERPYIERVELGPFFDDFFKLVQPELGAHGIRLTVQIEPDTVVLCDPRALHHVLLNLLTNASDALVGRDAPQVVVRCTVSDSIVVLRIEDNGAGISTEQQVHLFKPFSTTKPAGTGLGLVIARKLLAAMNCTIVLESTEERGTTAIVSLPNADPRSSRGSLRVMG